MGTGPDGGELKPPCQRCKREMRECVFRSERSWVKRRKPGEVAREGEEEEEGIVEEIQEGAHVHEDQHAQEGEDEGEQGKFAFTEV